MKKPLLSSSSCTFSMLLWVNETRFFLPFCLVPHTIHPSPSSPSPSVHLYIHNSFGITRVIHKKSLSNPKHIVDRSTTTQCAKATSLVARRTSSAWRTSTCQTSWTYTRWATTKTSVWRMCSPTETSLEARLVSNCFIVLANTLLTYLVKYPHRCLRALADTLLEILSKTSALLVLWGDGVDRITFCPTRTAAQLIYT